MSLEAEASKLSNTYGKWCNCNGVRGLLDSDDGAHVVSIVGRLNKFSAAPPHQAAHPMSVKATLRTINRGVALVLSALRWQVPTAGELGSHIQSATSQVRGQQWQLVMAYGGVEPLVKSILRAPGRGLAPAAFELAVSACALPAPEPVTVPNQSPAMHADWFDGAASNDLLAFLGLDAGDKTIVRRWLLQQTALTKWDEVLRLAKAIRNTTAHGALSATKVKRWKLGGTITRLTRDLGTFTTAIITRLAE
jgi:hypothetical protein